MNKSKSNTLTSCPGTRDLYFGTWAFPSQWFPFRAVACLGRTVDLPVFRLGPFDHNRFCPPTPMSRPMSESRKNVKMLFSLSAKDCSRSISIIFDFSTFSRFSNRQPQNTWDKNFRNECKPTILYRRTERILILGRSEHNSWITEGI